MDKQIPRDLVRVLRQLSELTGVPTKDLVEPALMAGALVMLAAVKDKGEQKQ